jgi:hypothetical protein
MSLKTLTGRKCPAGHMLPVGYRLLITGLSQITLKTLVYNVHEGYFLSLRLNYACQTVTNLEYIYISVLSNCVTVIQQLQHI